MGEAPAMYANLSDQTQIRLNKVKKIKTILSPKFVKEKQ